MEMKDTIKYLTEKSIRIGKYSDKLRESIKAIDTSLEEAFKTAGISYIDSEPICKQDTPYGTSYYKLCITKAEITQGQHNDAWGIFIVDSDDECAITPKWIGFAPREHIKAAVPRLPTFLEQYAQRIEFELIGYETASSMAESLKNKLNKEEA